MLKDGKKDEQKDESLVLQEEKYSEEVSSLSYSKSGC
jgi:hypothetical protein